MGPWVRDLVLSLLLIWLTPGMETFTSPGAVKNKKTGSSRRGAVVNESD